ncbi:hypothetical protein GCM10009127_25100 [Alteraurantiacibacter aestuarii]|uniref:CC0125/CC1285 family lipoprotein n=1 Tax=Alteraurantiacibacter aestuarii TaxID=650004 RepID=UPI0031D04032
MRLSLKHAKLGLAALLLATTVTGCMTPTPYQPDVRGQAVTGGYSEQRITENRFRVTFSGNSLTSRDRVEGYLLYRAAELTVQNGYDYFIIIDRDTEHDVRTYVQPDPLYRPWYGSAYPYWRPHWSYYDPVMGWTIWHPEYGDPFWARRVNVRTVERFEAHAEIVMHHGTPPADEIRAFVAREVMSNLGPTIEFPE